MPELPEVERVRRDLEPALLGRTVTAVRLRRRDVVATPDDPPGGFSRNRRAGREPPTPRRVPRADLLLGQRITALLRRGKRLAVVADSGRALAVHLGMTGRLAAVPPHARPRLAPHTHVSWTLDDGARLHFSDPRRFGGVWTFPSAESLARRQFDPLGPDALDIAARDLAPRLARAARPIKAALLDQAVLAGVGNIYADEALHRAGIHPGALARELAPERVGDLARAVRHVLRAALRAGGSTIRDYASPGGDPGAYQTSHRVYARAGLPCLACHATLESDLIAQRTTVWCPRCQPGPPGAPGEAPHLTPNRAGGRAPVATRSRSQRVKKRVSSSSHP